MSVRVRSRVLGRLLLAAAAATMLLGVALPATALEGETFAITRIDFDAGTIDITNHGESEVDPNGLIVCNFPAYAPIEGAPTLAPGESFTLELAAINIPVGAADGEMGLYLDGDFENPDSIVAYVEWGSTDHTRSPVGVEAGVWDGGSAEGGAAILESAADFPTEAGAWAVGSAPAGAQPEPETLPFTGVPTEAIAAFGVALTALGVGVLRADRNRKFT